MSHYKYMHYFIMPLADAVEGQVGITEEGKAQTVSGAQEGRVVTVLLLVS